MYSTLVLIFSSPFPSPNMVFLVWSPVFRVVLILQFFFFLFAPSSPFSGVGHSAGFSVFMLCPPFIPKRFCLSYNSRLKESVRSCFPSRFSDQTFVVFSLPPTVFLGTLPPPFPRPLKIQILDMCVLFSNAGAVFLPKLRS